MGVTDRGLIEHWRFEETSGSYAQSSKSHLEYNPVTYQWEEKWSRITWYGTENTQWGWYPSGHVGQGAWVNLVEGDTLHTMSLAQSLNDFTISVWVNPYDDSTEECLIAGKAQWNSSEQEWHCMGIYFPGNSEYGWGQCFSTYDGGFSLSSMIEFAPNTWHHLCARRIGSKLDFWINGTQYANQVEAGTYAWSANRFGGFPDSVGWQYLASIIRVDNLRFYNVGLLDVEIADLYAENSSNWEHLYPYPTASLGYAEAEGYVTMDPADCSSQATGDDAYWVVDPANVYSAAISDSPLISCIVIEPKEIASASAVDGPTVETAPAYPTGAAALNTILFT